MQFEGIGTGALAALRSITQTASGLFGWRGGDFELDVLDAEIGMVGGEAHLAGLLAGAYPDGAGAADQRKGLSPMICAGPVSSKRMASSAKGRMASNSSVTRRTTRVVSAPSATSAVSSGSSVNF